MRKEDIQILPALETELREGPEDTQLFRPRLVKGETQILRLDKPRLHRAQNIQSPSFLALRKQ